MEFHPLTPERWPDFKRLFGANGACGGCWCQLWRLKRSAFERGKGRKNRDRMRRIVGAGEVPGILAYAGGEPVGWCAVAPRSSYPALARSRVLKPLDAVPVWSIACLYVARSQRRRGISVRLLRAALAHVKARGGTVLEGYPIEPRADRVPDVFAWTGLASAFHAAGFIESGRGSPTRPIMRAAVAAPSRGRKSRGRQAP